jgi:hypothetical protein
LYQDTNTTFEIPTTRCMHSATGYWTSDKVYKDLIICKWELNGVDHFDSTTVANISCKKIGYSELFSTEQMQKFKNNDRETLRIYIVSSICRFNER